jgi:hypothetical protein
MAFKRLNKTKNRGIKLKKGIKLKRRNKTKKYKKIYKLKGGFARQDTINILYSSDLLDSINKALVPIFEILPTFSKDLVYVSFGSKLNERRLEDEYLDPDYTYMNRVNAGYQMVPFFLCSNSNPREKLLCDGRSCKVLNIVIDIFNDETDIETSKRYIIESLTNKSELDAPLDTSNITQFFINILDVRNGILMDVMKQPGKNPYTADEHHLFLGMIADVLCKKMKENEIADKNFMVCNYIKFKHPNPPEERLRVKVSETLSNIMNRNKYENSYYEWSGYGRMVFYNCIVLKKYIDIIEVGFNFNKFSVLNGFEKNQTKIFELNKSGFKKGEEKFRDILKYIYPIKNPYYEIEPPGGYPADNLNNFCYSVYDLMVE